MSRRVLKARDWKDIDRLQRAAGIPFHSMQMGQDGGTEAVFQLQGGLVEIELFNFFLPPRLKPVRVFSPFSANDWGPFEFDGFERQQRQFDITTHLAVRKFQFQAGIDPDGKAGMQTLTKMDEILFFIEKNQFSS